MYNIDSQIAAKREKAEKRMSEITGTSAAGIIASATASRKQIVPGLGRQPKTIAAVGIKSFLCLESYFKRTIQFYDSLHPCKPKHV